MVSLCPKLENIPRNKLLLLDHPLNVAHTSYKVTPSLSLQTATSDSATTVIICLLSLFLVVENRCGKKAGGGGTELKHFTGMKL